MPLLSAASRTLWTVVVSLLTTFAALAAPFTPGNIVIYRVGAGAPATLVNTGNPVFLDEYTPAGTLVQSIALPTSVASPNFQLVASGTSTSEGLLTRSADGRYLLLTGYASNLPGGASLSGTTSATIPRVVGIVDHTGAINTSTALTDFASGNSPRAAASDDGADLWVTGGAGGVRYAPIGSTTSTQLSTTIVNIRQAAIFGGQLYVSTGSGSALRVGTVGTGLPTASGQVITNLPGGPTAGGHYGFFFADLDAGVPGLDTLYVAADDAVAFTKYSLVGGNWVSNGVIGVASDAYRGITGVVNGSTVTLFLTRKGSSNSTGGGELVSLVDASGHNAPLTGTPTLLATAAPNTTFRGVALAPESGGVVRSVTLGVSANTASEAAGTVITVTATASGAVAGNQTVELNIYGANITPTDYNVTSTTITILDGQASGSVTLTILDDADFEGQEILNLQIQSPSAGVAIGNPNTQAITITDNEAQTVSLNVSATTGTEAAATVVTVTAVAGGPVAGNQTVQVAVTGTGVTATDYSLSNATITILDGQAQGSVTFTILDDADVEANETATLTLTSPSAGLVLGAPISRNITIVDNDGAPPPKIYEIQGTGHVSPFHGQNVTDVPGVVTAIQVASASSKGFYMQDETGDANPNTSDGIFVFVGSAAMPPIAVGDRILVSGQVIEFRPGCTTGTNNLSCVGTGTEDNAARLTLTEISSPTVTVLASAVPLPAPVIMGAAGRPMPTSSVSPACGGDKNVETPGSCAFDPTGNAIDYFEALEGMRVRVVDPVATSGFVSFDEFWVLGDNGAGATGRNARGGITIAAGDMNPERILLNLNSGANLSGLKTGTRWTGNFDGVMAYTFGDYKVDLPESFAMPAPVGGSTTLPQETTALTGTATKLTIASFNVENLGGNASASRFNELAAVIVNRMAKPDIVAVVEIQDNNGEQGGSCPGDGLVSATTTFANLINAVGAQPGGITYQFTQIDPQDCTDGGAPTGNIRVGFLYNPARVTFTPSAGGGTLVNTSVVNVGGQPRLQHNPGRIDPTNGAFTSSRKPLAAEFGFNGQTFIVVANHWNSKGGDGPEHGRFQPPVLTTEPQRLQIAAVVKGFVQSALNINANAKMVILGDLNDFPFAPAVVNFTATTPPLAGLTGTLAQNERYSYVFRGNSQVLDHIIVTPALATGAEYDVVHANSEYRDQVSDHDPEVALLDFGGGGPVAAKPFDLSGEGNADLLLRGPGGEIVSWLMNGTAISSATLLLGSSGYQATHVADLNGNGRADVLLRGPSDDFVGWLMNGSTITSASLLIGGGSGYTVAKTGDFDGDGRADLLLRHTNGTLVMWLMDGLSVTSSATVLGAGTGFSPALIADFNGDGRSDIVLTHTDGRVAIWLMNGTAIASSANVVGAGTGFVPSHAVDVSGDGRADLLFRGAADEIVLWVMNGTAITSSHLLLGGGTGYHVSHTGDFNADARADLLLEHTDGRIVAWLMNGSSLIGSALLVGPTPYRATHTLDFNNDGRADILLRGPSGQIVQWQMNGATIAAAQLLAGATTYLAAPAP